MKVSWSFASRLDWLRIAESARWHHFHRARYIHPVILFHSFIFEVIVPFIDARLKAVRVEFLVRDVRGVAAGGVRLPLGPGGGQPPLRDGHPRQGLRHLRLSGF